MEDELRQRPAAGAAPAPPDTMEPPDAADAGAPRFLTPPPPHHPGAAQFQWGPAAMEALKRLCVWAWGYSAACLHALPRMYKSKTYKRMAPVVMGLLLVVPVHTAERRPRFHQFPENTRCWRATKTLESYYIQRVIVLEVGMSGGGKTSLAESWRWICSGVHEQLFADITQNPVPQTMEAKYYKLEGSCQNIEMVDLRGWEQGMSAETAKEFKRMIGLAVQGRLAPGATVDNIIEIPQQYWLWDFSPRTAVVTLYVHDAGESLNQDTYKFITELAKEAGAGYTKPMVALTKSGSQKITEHLQKEHRFRDIDELNGFYNEASVKDQFRDKGIDPHSSFVDKNAYFSTFTSEMVPGLREEFLEGKLCDVFSQAATVAKRKAEGTGGAKERMDYLYSFVDHVKIVMFSTYLGYVLVRLAILVALGPLAKLLDAAVARLARLRLKVTYEQPPPSAGPPAPADAPAPAAPVSADS